MQTLGEQLDEIVQTSGLQHYLKKLSGLCVEFRFSDRYGIDESGSRFIGRKFFYVSVLVDVTGFAHGIDHEARYCRLKRVSIEGLIYAAQRFKAPPEILESLRDSLGEVPVGPPWPPIPEGPKIPPADPFDAGPSVDKESSFDAERGVLWIHTDDAEDEVIAAIVSELTGFVHDQQLGEWDGDSRGAGEADISFDVHDLKAAARDIRHFVEKTWPGRRFTFRNDDD